MKKVTHIESNIAGGVNLDLGDKTLVLGPSAGGKTTVVRALELALAGGTSDLEGRDWVGDDPRLLALMPSESSQIYSTAQLSDGTTAEFRKTAGSNANPKGGVSGTAQVLALRTVREKLTGAADKAREFIMGAACQEVTEADVLTRLPAGLHDLYGAAAAGRGSSPVDTLQAVQKHAAKRARDLKKEAKGAKAIVDEMAGHMAAPTEAQVTAATEAATALQERLWAARNATSNATLRNDLAHQIEQHEVAIEHWNVQLAGIPAPGPEDIAMQQQWARAQAIKQVIEGQRNSPVDCQLCGQKSPASALTARLDAMDKALDEALEGFAARQEALELRGRMEAKLAELTRAHAVYAQQLAALPAPSEGGDIEALQAEHTAAEKRRQDLLAAFQGQAQVQRARALAHEATEKADRFKRLETACKEAIAEIVDANLKSFTERVNKYMPKDMPFAVESGTRFRIGIGTADGGMRTALSGAEWVAVTTAIGCAVTEGSDIALLLPEERAYDPVMLAKIMRGLSKAPAQIVLTSTVRFRGKTPGGWTVVDLEAL